MFLALGCAVVVLTYALTGGSPGRADAAVRPLTKTAEKAPKPLVRTDPGISPWIEKDIPPPKPEAAPKPQADPDEPHPFARTASTQTASEPETAKKPESQNPQPKEHGSTGQNGPPQAHQQATHYQLPPGAIMTLTVPELGIKNAPVANSTSKSALDRGVVHLPDTSLPWSDTPERNVYLAGHRLGWAGTGSYRIFLRLNELTGGEKIILHGPNKTYTYKVTENFIVGPRANWVTGRVRDRDLVTLQTCTPIPTFQDRLIVRAERI
jgi:sortase A